ncbi:MAG: DUF3127 domain-containing protein [Bacteroidetes bacterium]|nr:DUF3127 domain-containing protein [Bacteroidota bacterium]
MEITGKIVEIFDEQQVTNTFKKREFVIEYADNPQYPEFIMFQAIQDKTAMLDSINVGDSVTVQFNLKGRKWQSPQGEVKYFNTLQAWRIGKPQTDGNNQDPFHSDVPPPEIPDAPSEIDDLPF